MEMPSNAFGYVPTPALVAPVEFTLRKADYVALGGHVDRIVPLEAVLSSEIRTVAPTPNHAYPTDQKNYRWAVSKQSCS